jgi:hypothetical protein
VLVPPVFPTHQGKDLWNAIQLRSKTHSPFKDKIMTDEEWDTITDLYYLFFPAQDQQTGFLHLEELWANTELFQGSQGHLQPLLFHLRRLAPTLSHPSSDQEVSAK